jgi:mannose/fructose/N-acetylgalactosamine-specific phosphotransferase system component IIB
MKKQILEEFDKEYQYSQLIYIQEEIKDFISQVIDETREETINNLNVGFLRQWLNEDRITDKEIVTDEEIMSFIKPYNK